MRVSTLRSTTREDDLSDKDCPSDDNYIPPFRVTRSSTRPTRASATADNTAASTAATTPSTTPKPGQKDTASRPKGRGTVGGGGAPPPRRGRRKRVRSPEMDTGDQSGSDELQPTEPREPIDDPQELTGRRSRSISVIPTVNMSPLTHPAPEDSAVHTLGLSQSARPGAQSLSFDPEQLVRMREGHFFRPRPERKTDIKRNWRLLSLSEAIWTRLEEVGSVGKGRAWTAREGYDEDGQYVKPELPYVLLTKLVIAASPRKMLTLSQIYQAMEERWPYFRTLGQTFRNSIRHNLSMNPAFVNVERGAGDPGGMGGKGGHWRVSESTTSSHRGRAKKARIEPPKTAPVKTSRAKVTSARKVTNVGDHSRPHPGRPVGRSQKKNPATKQQSAMLPPPSTHPLQYGQTAPPHGFMYTPYPPGHPVPPRSTQQYTEPDRGINQNIIRTPNELAYASAYTLSAPAPKPGPQSAYNLYPVPAEAQIVQARGRVNEPTSSPTYASGPHEYASPDHEYGQHLAQSSGPNPASHEHGQAQMRRLDTSPINDICTSPAAKNATSPAADRHFERSHFPWPQSHMPTPPYEHDEFDHHFSLSRTSASPPAARLAPPHKLGINPHGRSLPGLASLLNPPLSPNSDTSTSAASISATASAVIPLPAWA